MNSKYFVIVLICAVFFSLIYLFKPFLLVIAIAILMSVATANIHNAIYLKIKRKYFTPFIMTGLILMLFFAPLVYAGFSFANELKQLDINTLQAGLMKIKNMEFNLPNNLSFIEPKIKEFLNEIDINHLGKDVLNYASNFTKSGAKFIIDLILITIFYFFANYYGLELLNYFRSLMPIQKDEVENVLKEVSNVMSVVFYSVIFNAVFQGILFGCFVSFYNYDGLLMGILYAISSLIPIIGGALLWLLVSLLEYSQGNTTNAIVIALYTIIIISGIADTLIKPFIIKWINEKFLKTSVKINELLIFFAMIAGISTFGFWGVILGPAILALFLSVVKLYLLIIEREVNTKNS
ncbi:AI-2E family transporter [Campylobacter canadensis]|uniref:AI-2E family transporter n=1 Tax=Campylobacter canadensis TaxID=449520 RepID=UPI001CCADED4|nr:AI-2E family transporter [Campylobacter canadensis]MBZ8004445.1 AI-2E family transporter [Campylobacter canadensis]